MSSTYAAPSAAGVPPGLIGLLAALAGLSVATLYYNQPMLARMGESLEQPADALGWIPMLTQLGYAVGIFLLAPLGDRYDRRRIILGKSVMLVVALVASALAPDMAAMLLASLGVGIAATLAQDAVPAAAAVAPEAQRGRAVGAVMTGLFLGILLSRTVSGWVAEVAGWRVMYGVAAVSIVLMVWVAARRLPRFAPTTALGYGALLGSLFTLWRRYPSLRRTVLAQALLALGFSAFWSCLAVALQESHGLGSAAVGAFGLAGAAGALAAPLAGRLADRRGPVRVAQLGSLFAVLGFASLGLWPWLASGEQLVLLAFSAVVFDFGVQAALVASQTQVYGLEPAARSRLNALLVCGMFLGMAAGAALGGWVLAQAGWLALVGLMTASAVLALLLRLPVALRWKRV